MEKVRGDIFAAFFKKLRGRDKLLIVALISSAN